MKNIKALAALMSFTMVAGASACKPGQILPAVNVATTIAVDASQILSVIEMIARTFFALHPMPQVEPTAEKLIQDCHLALSTAMHATDGVKELDQGQIDQAFQAFRDSYGQLQALLMNVGAVSRASDGRSAVSHSGAGAVVLPEPMAIHYQVKR